MDKQGQPFARAMAAIRQAFLDASHFRTDVPRLTFTVDKFQVCGSQGTGLCHVNVDSTHANEFVREMGVKFRVVCSDLGEQFRFTCIRTAPIKK